MNMAGKEVHLKRKVCKMLASLTLASLLLITVGATPAFAIDGYIDGTADGWYFIKDAYNARQKPIAETECQKILENLQAMQSEMNDAGIFFVVFIAPDKEEIYGELLPDSHRLTQPDPIEQLTDYLHTHAPDLPVIYAKDSLVTAKETKTLGAIPLYYGNDAHWNFPGAYLAAQELIRVVGEHFAHGNGSIKHTFSHTSQVKYNNTWTDYYTYDEPPRSVLTRRLMNPENHDSVYAWYTSTYPGCWPEKVFFAGDSFRLNTEPVLSERFHSLVSINRYYLDLEKVAEEAPDVFVLSAVGRFARDDLLMISGFNTAALPLAGMMTKEGASGWEMSPGGYWWREADGTFPHSEWKWLDGNSDGIYECYYFDENGYCLIDAVAPDGKQVNADGAWVADGVVQIRSEEEMARISRQ